MKKIVSFLLITGFVFLFTLDSIAQSCHARLGMNFSGFNQFDENGSYNNYRMIKPGWNVGGVYEFFPGNRFSIETGLILESKGEKYDYTKWVPSEFTKAINITRLIYLDLPVMGKLNIPVGKKIFFAAAGPYVGLGLLGWEESITTPKTNLNTRSLVGWGNKSDNRYRRIDYGGKAMLGVEYGNFQFSLFYSAGLRDIYNFDRDHHKTLNQSGGFTIGYKVVH
ncbi:MAG: PorT family protein [Bacteroidales bacterium]|nr:PorT family protein [Bacteroidales bacterium]